MPINQNVRCLDRIRALESNIRIYERELKNAMDDARELAREASETGGAGRARAAKRKCEHARHLAEKIRASRATIAELKELRGY